MTSKIGLFNKLKAVFAKIAYSEKSPKKLALSFAIGIYIAFSPYLGLHNIMIFVFSWFFRLNTLATFTAAHINNPLTTVPVLSICYMFGKWVINDVCGSTVKFCNPEWINSINSSLTHYLGAPQICFWTFFIGANLLGLILAFGSYPIMKYIFKKLVTDKQAKQNN